MPTVTHSVEIPAAPDEVWVVATDWGRYAEWNVTHSAFPDGPPPSEPGATFKERITVMGMPGEAIWTVAETNPPSLTAWHGEGPMGIRLGNRLQLDPSGDGTKVTIEVSFEGGPLAGPLGDSVAASARKGAAESLEKLKALVS
jgi:hypothetical protein